MKIWCCVVHVARVNCSNCSLVWFTPWYTIATRLLAAWKCHHSVLFYMCEYLNYTKYYLWVVFVLHFSFPVHAISALYQSCGADKTEERDCVVHIHMFRYAMKRQIAITHRCAVTTKCNTIFKCALNHFNEWKKKNISKRKKNQTIFICVYYFGICSVCCIMFGWATWFHGSYDFLTCI